MAPKDNPVTIYSNMVQVKVTPAELVLEFGTFFPDTTTSPGPKDFVAETRIVLNVNALEQLTNMLATAVKSRNDASNNQQMPPSAKAQ